MACQQRNLSHSPIGAIANEFDGLKVALQRFPARRGACDSALNHIKNTKREIMRNLVSDLVWINKALRTLL